MRQLTIATAAKVNRAIARSINATTVERVRFAVSAMTDDDLYLSDVLLLCVTCKQPIKARINTPGWIKVEWISPVGECQGCYNQKKVSDEKSRH